MGFYGLKHYTLNPRFNLRLSKHITNCARSNSCALIGRAFSMRVTSWVYVRDWASSCEKVCKVVMSQWTKRSLLRRGLIARFLPDFSLNMASNRGGGGGGGGGGEGRYKLYLKNTIQKTTYDTIHLV